MDNADRRPAGEAAVEDRQRRARVFAFAARVVLVCNGHIGLPRSGPMQAEREVVRFLSAYQAIWHAHFPSLFRRAQWHIVTHLCTNGRDGAAVGELYGLVKQVFLLDNSTVKERILEIRDQQLCLVDPPTGALVGPFRHRSDSGAARSVRSPSAGAGERTLHHCRRARSGDAGRGCRAGSMHSRARIILQSLARCREPWRIGSGSHLRCSQPVAGTPGRGDPSSELAVALDIAAHGGRAALWRFHLRRRRPRHPGRSDGRAPAQSDRAEFPDHARSHRLPDRHSACSNASPASHCVLRCPTSAAEQFHRGARHCGCVAAGGCTQPRRDPAGRCNGCRRRCIR